MKQLFKFIINILVTIGVCCVGAPVFILFYSFKLILVQMWAFLFDREFRESVDYPNIQDIKGMFNFNS